MSKNIDLSRLDSRLRDAIQSKVNKDLLSYTEVAIEPDVTIGQSQFRGVVDTLYWDSVLQRMPIVSEISSKSPVEDVLRAVLQRQVSLEQVAQVIRDIDIIEQIIRYSTSASNRLVRVGSTLTSTPIVYNETIKLMRNSSPISVRLVAILIDRYLEVLKLSEVVDDWAITMDDGGMATGIQYAVIQGMNESYAKNLSKLLPVKSTHEGKFATTTELAHDFIRSHQKFYDAIIRFGAYRNDLDSFLTRLNAKITNTAYVRYGKDADIFLNNAAFQELSTNLTLIMLASDPIYSSNAPSSAVVWNLEDSRLLDAFIGGDDISGFKLVSKQQFITQFKTNIITDKYGKNRKIAIVSPIISSQEKTRLFGVLKQGNTNRYIYDNRLEQITNALPGNDLVYTSYLDRVSAGIQSLITDSEKEKVIYISVLQEDISMLAFALSESYVYKLGDTGGYSFVFKIPHDNLKNISPDLVASIFLDDNLTEDPNLAILANSFVTEGTSPRFTFKDILNFNTGYKYDHQNQRLISLVNREVTIDIDSQKLRIDINFEQDIVPGLIKDYVITNRIGDLIGCSILLSSLEILRMYITKSDIQTSNFIYIKLIVDLLKSYRVASAFIRRYIFASIFKYADGKNIARSAYNDRIIRAKIDLSAIQLTLDIVGIPIDVNELVSTDTDYIIELLIDIE